jgi:hypothetical protein
MKAWKRLGIVGALLLGASIAAGVPVHAAGSNSTGSGTPGDPALVVNTGWQEFDWVGGDGTFAVQDFTFVNNTPQVVTVTDALCPGDRFAIYDNGVFVANTSVPGESSCAVPDFTFSPDQAYADNNFSHGVIVFGAGSHDITIQAITSPFASGSGFIRLDPFDTTPPSCTLVAVLRDGAGNTTGIQIQVSDFDNNLAPTQLTGLGNATLAPSNQTYPDPNTVGEYIPVQDVALGGGPVQSQTIEVDKTVISQGSFVALQARDSALNATACDPVMTSAIRSAGQPQADKVQGVQKGDHLVTVWNGTVGVENLTINVNGQSYTLHGLRSNQKLSVDIGAALSSASNNVTVTTSGRPGASASLLFGNV